MKAKLLFRLMSVFTLIALAFPTNFVASATKNTKGITAFSASTVDTRFGGQGELGEANVEPHPALQSTSWVSGGPYGGAIGLDMLAVSPTDSNIVFAGTGGGGLFK